MTPANARKLLERLSFPLDELNKKVLKNTRLSNSDIFALNELERITDILKGQLDPGGRIGIAFVEKTLRIDRKVITNWRKQGFPITINNAVKTSEVLHFFFKHSKLGNSITVLDKDMEEFAFDSPSLERFRSARASQEEIKLAEKLGKLVSLDESIESTTKILSIFWGAVLNFKDKLPNALYRKSAKQIKSYLEKEVSRLGEEITHELIKLKPKKYEDKPKANSKPKKVVLKKIKSNEIYPNI